MSQVRHHNSSVSRTVLGGHGLRRHETIVHVQPVHTYPTPHAKSHHHPWWSSAARLSFGLAPRRPLFFCGAARLHAGFICHPDSSDAHFGLFRLVWLQAAPRSASLFCDSLRSGLATGQTTVLWCRSSDARRFSSAGLIVGASAALLRHSGRRAQRAGLSRSRLGPILPLWRWVEEL